MKFFQSHGIEINFFDSETPNADAVIFVHGNSESSMTFRHQLGTPSLAKYRRIALDLPGHGDSGPAGDYSMELFVSVIQDLVIELEVQRFILVGHSLGGHIALHALSLIAPQGVFIFGSPPLTKPLDMRGFRSRPELAALFKNDVSDAEALDLLRIMYLKRPVTESDLTDFRKTDILFREKLAQSFSEGRFEDEVLLLQAYSGRVTLLALSQDELVDGDHIRASFPDLALPVPGPHNLHQEAPAVFNAYLATFCHETFNSQGSSANEHRIGKNSTHLEGDPSSPWTYPEGTGPTVGNLSGQRL